MTRFDRAFESRRANMSPPPPQSSLSYYNRRTVTVRLTILLSVECLRLTALAGSVDQVGDAVSSARCRVRCLTLFQQRLDIPPMSPAMESITLLNCLQESICEACLRPCNQLFLGDNLCEDACRLPKDEEVCTESCRFLKQINSIRPGTCPPEISATGNAARCVKGCHNDADCDSNLKCCSNSCGWTCQPPNHLDEGMPEKPEKPEIRERLKSGSVELRWNSVALNSSGPILYLIDSRRTVGKQFSDSDQTTWQQVAQTTGTSTVIGDVTAGHYYQFRVTSVNIYGSRGASNATLSFTLSREPKKPGPPTNLTEGDTLITGGKVSVTLQWLPPRKSDLPVTRYKLYWSKKLKSSPGHHTTPKEFRQIIPGDRLTYQIPDLEPETAYFIQLQAICQFRHTKLKSERASISITTYPLPKSIDELAEIEDMLPGSSPQPYPAPPSVLELTVDRPYYHNGDLKANVSWIVPEEAFHDESDDIEIIVHWSPEACIADTAADSGLTKVMSSATQENFLILTDLRFDCRYQIRVEPINGRGISGVASNTTLSTPSCNHVHVVGKTKPDCPNTVTRLPAEPRRLQYTFLISNSNITARLTWEAPDVEMLLTGYRVIWGLLLQSHSSKMDKSSSLTKVLPKESKSINIGGLMEATTYIAQVQALSRLVPGRIASIQFTTPLLQASRLDPPYHELEANHNDLDRKQENSRKKQEIAAVFATNVFTSTFGSRPDVLLRNAADKQTSKLFTRNLASNFPGCLCLVIFLWVIVDSLLQ